MSYGAQSWGRGGGRRVRRQAASVTVKTLVEGAGGPAGEKVGLPRAESLLGEVSGLREQGGGPAVVPGALAAESGLGQWPFPSASPPPTPTPSGLVPHSSLVLSLLPGHSFCHLGNLSVLEKI